MSKARRFLAVAAAVLLAAGGLAVAQPPRAAAAPVVYTAPKKGSTAGLGTIWSYEEEPIDATAALSSGQFTALSKSSDTYAGTKGVAVYTTWDGAAFPMAVGANGNAVIVFTVPEAGTVTLPETTVTLLNAWETAFDGVGLTIYVDDQLIWPEAGTRRIVKGDQAGDAPSLTIPPITDIAVEEGTKIRFVADLGQVNGNNWGDTVIWPARVSLEKRTAKPTVTDTYRTPHKASPDLGTVWSYQAGKVNDHTASLTSASFVNMTLQTGGTYQGLYAGTDADYPARIDVTAAGDAFPMIPHIRENAVVAFTVPEDGTLTIAESTATLLSAWEAAFDGVGIVIYHNDTKIWPQAADREVVTESPVTVPALTDIAAAAGDVIRFIADVGKVGGNEWGDNLLWPVTLSLTHEKDLGPVETRTYPAPKYGAQYGLDTRWIYEAETFAINAEPHSGAFSLMTKSDKVTELGAYYAGSGEGVSYPAKVLFDSQADGYLLLPHAQQNAVMTFVSPGYGTVAVAETVVKRSDGAAQVHEDGAGLSVYLNEEKVWPADKAHEMIDNATHNTLTVPALTDLEVTPGDKLRFIVDLGTTGGVNYNDEVTWPAVVTYTGTNALEAPLVADPTITTEDPDGPDDDNEGYKTAQYKAPNGVDDGLNWPDVWLYAYEALADENDLGSGVFEPMTVEVSGDRLASGVKKEADFSARDHAQVLYWTDKLTYPIQPGYLQNAAVTFIAPKDGVITIPAATVVRHGAVASCDGDGAGLRILVDDRQVWPAQGEQALVSDENHNTLTIPELTGIEVQMDAVIRFVVDKGVEGGNNWCDDVIWPAAVTYTQSSGDDDEEIIDPDNHPDKTAMEFYAPTLENPSLGLVWTYEYESLAGAEELYSGVFGNMVKKKTDYGLYQGNRQFDEAAHALVLRKAGATLPMRPGTEQNILLTFTAPRAGTIRILASEAVRHGGTAEGDGTGLSIVKDRNQQLWPDGGVTLVLDEANGNRVAIPEIADIEVEAGTKISFVVDIGAVGGDNIDDDVVWPVTIRYEAETLPTTTRPAGVTTAAATTAATGAATQATDPTAPATGAAGTVPPLVLAATAAGAVILAGGIRRKKRQTH